MEEGLKRLIGKKRNWKGEDDQDEEQQQDQHNLQQTVEGEIRPAAAVEDVSQVSESENEQDDDSSIEEGGLVARVLDVSNVSSNAETPHQDRSRQSRKKSKVWNCFERGDYNKIAHRFSAACKFCGKKFDGRLPKLRSHVIDCTEIHPEEKALCLKESDSDESEEERPDAPESVGGNIVNSNSSVPAQAILSTPPQTERSRRGRPASKLWDCFIRGAYSKSAHRFTAVCKYCQATIDGRKLKLKNHVLVCGLIDQETKDAYRTLNIEEGATPKKSRLLESNSKGNQTKSGKKGAAVNLKSSLQSDDVHSTLNFNHSQNGNSSSNTANDPQHSLYYPNDPHDYLLKFFLHYGLPFTALKDTNFQTFLQLIHHHHPNGNLNFFNFHYSKEELINLITRNYNFLKQQEINQIKNETFLSVIFHHEQNDSNKWYSYFTSLVCQNQQVYPINSFHLENKNEIHLYSDRWKHAIQSSGKVVAITCDSEENYKITSEWVGNFENFHRITVVRCFGHVLVEFAASIFGHPYAIPTISDALFLVKNLRSFYLSSRQNVSSASSSGGNNNGKGGKYEQLLEQIYNSLHLVTRNRFTSLLLMIESIIKLEGLLVELKSYARNNNHQSAALLPIINSSKFWSSIKILYSIMKPFLDILYHLETLPQHNLNQSLPSHHSHHVGPSYLTIADTSVYWIYLTNQLERQLSFLPDDYRSYIINIYNNKLLNNHFLSEIHKLAIFLHPNYIKGLFCYQENFFKLLLKFSCTFLQGYGYNEIECGKLISQMIAYRNTSYNVAEFPDNLELKNFWESMNQQGNKGDFQTLQTVVSIILEIIPLIVQGGGKNGGSVGNGGVGQVSSSSSSGSSIIQMNGQLPTSLLKNSYENFFPDLKTEINNLQFLTMIETIRTHEIFSKTETIGYSANDDDLSDLTNSTIERYELTNCLEIVYRRDLATLFKSTDTITTNQDTFIKSDGINYNHPVFNLQGKFNKREVFSTIHSPSFGSPSSSYDKLSSTNRKAETSTTFDIDALIEMTYNS